MQPQLLEELIAFIESYETQDALPAYRGYFIAVGMFVTAILQTVRPLAAGPGPPLSGGCADHVAPVLPPLLRDRHARAQSDARPATLADRPPGGGGAARRSAPPS